MREFHRETVWAQEPFSVDLFQEALPLLVEHWQEISHNKDIPLDPDLDAYLRVAESGSLRVFTVRRGGALIGYAVFIVRRNLHYKTSLQAVQDVLFIRKSERGGTGIRFIKFCDNMLRSEGVQVVYQHVKAAHNFGPLLVRLGYECVEEIYSHRLDKET